MGMGAAAASFVEGGVGVVDLAGIPSSVLHAAPRGNSGWNANENDVSAASAPSLRVQQSPSAILTCDVPHNVLTFWT